MNAPKPCVQRCGTFRKVWLFSQLQRDARCQSCAYEARRVAETERRNSSRRRKKLAAAARSRRQAGEIFFPLYHIMIEYFINLMMILLTTRAMMLGSTTSDWLDALLYTHLASSTRWNVRAATLTSLTVCSLVPRPLITFNLDARCGAARALSRQASDCATMSLHLLAPTAGAIYFLLYHMTEYLINLMMILLNDYILRTP